MALDIQASIVTPTSVTFSDTGADFTMVIYKLDENNSWEEYANIDEPVDTITYVIPSDGVYHFHITEDAVTPEEVHYTYLSYETIKSKLRTYIQKILCSCCEDNCNPCSDRVTYDFTMLSHLSLPYLGGNEYLLQAINPTVSPHPDRLEAINNAIVRTNKYILNYDI